MMIVTNNLDLICVASKNTPILFVADELEKIDLFRFLWAIGFEKSLKEINDFFDANGTTKDDYLRVRSKYNEYQDPITLYYLWQLSYYKRTRYSLLRKYNAGFGNNDYKVNPKHIRMIIDAIDNSAFFDIGKEDFFEHYRTIGVFIIWFGDDEYVYNFALANNIPTLCIKDTNVNVSAEVLWKLNCDEGQENEMCNLFNDCRREWQ